jgi:hypothetical protein
METSDSPGTTLSRQSLDELSEEISKTILRRLAEVGWGPSDQIELAERWQGGDLVLQPRNGQEKVIPMDIFFRKIVLARERLRVLEQKINQNPKLEDGDRIELQKYITQIYGSFTTFNVLFEDRLDWFVGQKGDR